MRARLADGGCDPWMAFACERLHRRGPRALAKNYPFSPELRGFAPSREPVISARLVPQHERLPGNPSRPCDIAPSPDGPGPHAATNVSRDTSGAKHGPRSSDNKYGECVGSLLGSIICK
ncbi:MAG: hypothetical protein M0Q43_03950 [Methanothrix sp.]|nr:hypothetical protein [Methanothrix sp.]